MFSFRRISAPSSVFRTQVATFAKKVGRSGTAPLTPTGATSNELGAAVPVPVRLFGVGGRYATALFQAAARRGALDDVERDMVALRTLSGRAKEFMKDPTVSKRAKAETILADLDKVQANELTKNFMVLLAENGRLAQVDKIVEAFEQIMSAHRGEISAVVTSAEPLQQSAVQQLTDALQKMIKAGQSLKVSTKVDPTIVGGLIVDMGDKQIDMSVTGRIQKLRAALAAPM